MHSDSGKTEFSPEEDAHIIADCVKVSTLQLLQYIDFFLLVAAYCALVFIDLNAIF